MWTIIWGDALFRIVAPDGQESAAVHYCTMVTFEYQGRVFGCYLSGDEVDDAEMQVYDMTDWPDAKPVPTQCEEAEFEGEDGTAEEKECPECAGNGFIFVPTGSVIDIGGTK